MTEALSEPTVLRAVSGADFLAALPRLTGMRAPDSAYVVLFGSGEHSTRTLGAVRVDLPTVARLSDLSKAISWAAQVVDVARHVPGADSVVIVIDTARALTEHPSGSTVGFMSLMLIGAAEKAGLELRDLLAQAPDGWAEMLQGRRAVLRPLAEIAASTLYDMDATQLSLDEWRARHPGQTSDSPEDMRRLAERAVVATRRQVNP